jgi:hypothetical protein
MQCHARGSFAVDRLSPCRAWPATARGAFRPQPDLPGLGFRFNVRGLAGRANRGGKRGQRTERINPGIQRLVQPSDDRDVSGRPSASTMSCAVSPISRSLTAGSFPLRVRVGFQPDAGLARGPGPDALRGLGANRRSSNEPERWLSMAARTHLRQVLGGHFQAEQMDLARAAAARAGALPGEQPLLSCFRCTQRRKRAEQRMDRPPGPWSARVVSPEFRAW